MSEELEAIGTAVQGGLVAKALENEGGEATGDQGGNCLNCESSVTGRYCGNCGQPLHVHRSIGAFWHDILHAVLHFEGKFWRTLPLLAWKPGELTRRYARGERAKFISPMALFLFSIFMMFAIFSFLGDPFPSEGDFATDSENAVTRAEQLDREIKTKTGQLPQATAGERAELEEDILALKKGRNIMAILMGDDAPFPEVSLGDGDVKGSNITPEQLDQVESGLGELASGKALTSESSISTGSSEADMWIRNALAKVSANPDLLLYKLKANGYKFAWLLIPISLPFVWLTIIGRRGYHFYDHAVFATYSISFMTLLFITCSVLAALGFTESVWATLLIFYPPFHMYRQLRHAYQLPRIEALLRVSFLLMFTVISLLLFFAILLALGVLG